MAERRKRGLGRGLGALIPDAAASERPVDVFFSGGEVEEPKQGNGEETKPARSTRTDPAASMQSSRRRKAKTGASAKTGSTAKSGSTDKQSSGGSAPGGSTGSKSSAARTTAGSDAAKSTVAKPSTSKTSAKTGTGASKRSQSTSSKKTSTDEAPTTSVEADAAPTTTTESVSQAEVEPAESKTTSNTGRTAGTDRKSSSSSSTSGSTRASERVAGTRQEASESQEPAPIPPADDATSGPGESDAVAQRSHEPAAATSAPSPESATPGTDGTPEDASESAEADVSADDVLETHPGVYRSAGDAPVDRATPKNETTSEVNGAADGSSPVREEAAEDSTSHEDSATSETSDDESVPEAESPAFDEKRATGTEGQPSESEADDEESAGVESIADTEYGEIDVDLVDPNPRQPRTVFDEDQLAELVHSIREIGVLQPVVVRQKPGETPRYELIMGERRLRAAKEAGLAEIPAIIRHVDDTDLLRDALLENLHRAELNPLEEAAAYGQLLEDFGCTQEELSEKIGRSRPQISNTLRLLRLPPLVQRRVAAGVISAGHARAILGLKNPEHMEVLAQRIVAEGLSVRASEEAVILLNRGDSVNVSRATSKVAPEFIEVAERLGDRLETKVNITVGKRKGKLSVEFANQEDLDRILGILGITDLER